MRSRMSQAQLPHWGLLPQARNTSDGRRAPALTAASTSRSRIAPQMQMYMPRPVRFGQETHCHTGRDAAHAIRGARHHSHVTHEGEACRLEVGAERYVIDVAGSVLVGETHRVGAPVRIDRAVLQAFVA